MTMAKPNLIFLLTDQQRSDTIAALGNAHMITPHMDRLAASGVAYEQAYCPGATCAASRAAIFTGLYAHNTGTYSFNDWAHHRTWVQDLSEAGYWCVNMGKMHFMPRDAKGGFHERVIVENPTSVSPWGGDGDDAWGQYLAFHGMKRPNYRHRTTADWAKKYQGVPWEWEEHLHSDVFTASSAISWIRAREDQDPFFLQVGFPGPHEPWDAPQRWVDRYMERTDAFPEPVPGRGDGKPPQHEATRRFHATCDHESRIDLAEASSEDLRRMQAHYYAKTSYVDEQIGRVMEALDERGFLENAVVVLGSDHGEHLADHGMVYKWLMHESVVHVPLVFWEKNPRHLRAGRRSELVSLIDLGPTFLELAGCTVPTRLEGLSLASSLRDEPGRQQRAAVFCEDNYLLMMRTATHKLVQYFGQSDGELYDLEADPGERINLWNAPEHHPLRQALQVRLLEWLGTSCYLAAGYKQQGGSDYSIRWPTASGPSLHGANHQPRPPSLFC